MADQLLSTMQDSPLTIPALMRHGATVYADSVVSTFEGDGVRQATGVPGCPAAGERAG